MLALGVAGGFVAACFVVLCIVVAFRATGMWGPRW